MSRTSFDIDSLLRFRPARYLCEKCFGLLAHAPEDAKSNTARCPLCGVIYVPTEEYANSWDVGRYLDEQGFGLRLDNLIEHSRHLAEIANRCRQALALPRSDVAYHPLSGLFECLLHARKFVHFVSYGISHMLLGAIKMTAQRVPVRGIVSNVEEGMIEELTKFPKEAPLLKVNVFERKAPPQRWDSAPHQKIIVVDGLLAFKGSANLTLSGWRKASEGRDVIELVTDVEEVIDLHNRYFSRIWAEFDDATQIWMSSTPF